MQDPGFTWHGRSVLVTGGCGFIGTHLCRRLVREGARVRILDDLSTGVRPHGLLVENNVQFIESSITEYGCLQEASEGCQHIFHLAAIVSVPECAADPSRARSVNVEGTKSLINLATENNASLVFASSCAVYGNKASLPCLETDCPAPGSLYATSKLEAESAILQAHADGNLLATPLRFFNVFGPGQRADVAYAAVVSAFANAATTGSPLTIDGDGTQTRDFVPVSLAVDALCRAAAEPAGEPINVGTGRETSLLQLIDTIEQLCGHPIERQHGPPRCDDILRSVADTQRLTSRYMLPGDIGSPEAVRQTLNELLGDCERHAS